MLRSTILILVMGFVTDAWCGSLWGQQSVREQLWAAVRNSEAAEITRLLDSGADVNEANEMGVTALWIAAGKGKAEIVQLLVDRGADVNARDGIWYQTPLSTAIHGASDEIVHCLLEAGASDIDDAARTLAAMGKHLRLKVMLETGKVSQGALDAMLFSASGNRSDVEDDLDVEDQSGADDNSDAEAKSGAGDDSDVEDKSGADDNSDAEAESDADDNSDAEDDSDAEDKSGAENKSEVIKLLKEAGAKPLPEAAEADRQRWSGLAGNYESDMGGSLELAVEPVGLVIKTPGGNTFLREVAPDQFVPLGSKSSSIVVERSGGKVTRAALRRFTSESLFYPAKETAKATAIKDSPTEAEVADVKAPAIDWPQFRGPDATGIADGQLPPVNWNVKTGENVKWKTPIPGLGHSCPVVSKGRVFLTTAVSGDADPTIRIGNYGDVGSVDDKTEHTWHVLCLDAESGEILWNREVHKGVPKIKRHLKGSQANCTAATDGQHVVACFGSEGLYCLDFDGKLLWSRDLSAIDSSFALDEEYEWGFAGSPLIHEGQVFVQFDLSRDSFIAAYSLADGSKVWETPRDEIPSWSSPTIWRNSRRTELVTNASQFARSYNPATGEELWRLAKKSEATIPAPVPCGDLLIICSGNRPIQPIFAVKSGASGDISLGDNETSNEFIAWSLMRGGPYMPTPVVYGDYLYVCSNIGVLTCYELATGRLVYRERIGGSSFTASPIVGDNRIYLVAENGEVSVVKAGPKFELLAENEIGDICMTVPAISGGVLFIRSQHNLFALQRDVTLPTESADPAGTKSAESAGDGPADDERHKQQ